MATNQSSGAESAQFQAPTDDGATDAGTALEAAAGQHHAPVATRGGQAGEPCTLRPAVSSDVPALIALEREAFPTQWPPTNFEREIRKPNQLYLVAVCPRRPQLVTSDAEAEDASADEDATVRGDRQERPTGLVGRVLSSLKSLATSDAAAADTSADHVAGYVGIWFVVDEAHITSIAVRQADRRHGVGELLMLGAINAALERRCNEVTLEVRQSNAAARALYRKYRFREVGLRKRYYVDNDEDAVIMTTPPINNPEYIQALRALTKAHEKRWNTQVRPAATEAAR